MIRVGSRGKTLGLLKINLLGGSFDFEDRSGLERDQRSLGRYKKQRDKMIEQADGKDPMKIYEEGDRRYKRAKRIKEKIDLDQYDMVYAYGDSRGDREMLALADEPF